MAIGASDSVGVGSSIPDQLGWVPLFHGAMPAGSSLVNLGVSGSTLRDALDQQLPVALAAQPDVVTVWLAVNDLNAQVPLDRYAADLERLLAALASTKALVLLGNVPDVSLLPMNRQVEPALVRSTVQAWNSAIASAADRHGAVVVDIYSAWQELADHPEYLAADGFHPSDAGYQRLAVQFRHALEATEASRRQERD